MRRPVIGLLASGDIPSPNDDDYRDIMEEGGAEMEPEHELSEGYGESKSGRWLSGSCDKYAGKVGVREGKGGGSSAACEFRRAF